MRTILKKFTPEGIRDFLKVVGRGYRREMNNLVRPALQAVSLNLSLERKDWLETLQDCPSALLPGMAFYALPLVFDEENAKRFEERFLHCSDEVDNMLYTLVSLAIALVVSGTELEDLRELEDGEGHVLLKTFPH